MVKYRCRAFAYSRSWQVAIKALRFHTGNEEDKTKLNKVGATLIECYFDVLNFPWIQRLRRELNIWRRLNHENILPLCGVVSDFGPYPSMVCPWLECGNLNNYLERKNDLAISDRFRLVSFAMGHFIC